jgi:hypothetical protein
MPPFIARNRGDLVRLGAGGDLGQHKTLFAAPALTICKADLPRVRSNERREADH